MIFFDINIPAQIILVSISILAKNMIYFIRDAIFRNIFLYYEFLLLIYNSDPFSK
jgi:hypothetical protein